MLVLPSIVEVNVIYMHSTLQVLYLFYLKNINPEILKSSGFHRYNAATSYNSQRKKYEFM